MINKNNGIIKFNNNPSVAGYAAVGCEDEGKGRFGEYFDAIFDDPFLGQKSWEAAESQLQNNAFKFAVAKSKLQPDEIGCIFAGDLLNQCAASTFGLMGYNLPFVGVYGACSTMALSLIMASIFVNCGICDNAAAITSSHFCSAERQFRFPLEYGGQRPPTAQWTASAAGSVILSSTIASNIVISGAAIGRVVDPKINDANNMGAAMAPDDVKIRPYPINEGMVFFYTQIQ